jgi:hypothetical protein
MKASTVFRGFLKKASTKADHLCTQFPFNCQKIYQQSYINSPPNCVESKQHISPPTPLFLLTTR